MTNDNPIVSAVPKTAGQQTVEKFQQQQQLSMMTAANMQFVGLVSSMPPPSKMPIEVRRQMYILLSRSLALFSPRDAEEEAFYAEQGE